MADEQDRDATARQQHAADPVLSTSPTLPTQIVTLSRSQKRNRRRRAARAYQHQRSATSTTQRGGDTGASLRGAMVATARPASAEQRRLPAHLRAVQSALRAESGEAEAQQDEIAALDVMKTQAGGRVPRQTLPTNANVLGMLPWAYLQRRQYQSIDLTSLTAGEFNTQQLLDLLADAWPELSQALWNIVRLASTDYAFEVRTIDNKQEDTEGKALIDALLARVNTHWGGFGALVSQWITSVALQGACAGECVPSADFESVLDIVPVQPWTIYFQRDLLQQYLAFQWQPMMAAAGSAALMSSIYPGQNPGNGSMVVPNMGAKLPSMIDYALGRASQHGGFRELNMTTFGYVPIDADVDDPYGRLPLAAALQLVAFDAQLLKDLRQWSHNSAWGRLDVSINAEAVKGLMPEGMQRDAKKMAAWFNQYLDSVVTQYQTLNPDDTFVHWDNVEVTAVDPGGRTFDIDNLVRMLERRVFRALHQLPILMGSNEGTTETWGSLQMEVYARGITSIQKTVASLITKLLNTALRIYGRTSVVEFTFDAVRSTDRIKDATAERLEIQNAATKRDEGWITQDEASVQVTGSKSVAKAPDPDDVAAANQPDAGAPHSTVPPADTPEDDASKEPASDAAAEDVGKEEGDGKDAADKASDDAEQTGQSDQQKSSDDKKDDEKGRAFLADVLTRALVAAQVEARASDSDAQHTHGPSAARAAQRASLAEAVRAYMREHYSVSRSRLEHAISLHSSRAVANAHQTPPDVADAVAKVAEMRVRRIARTGLGVDTPAPEDDALRLSSDELAALVASLMRTLEVDFPDAEPDLIKLLVAQRLATWNAAGAEALAAVGLEGDFDLENSAILSSIDRYASAQAALIQQSTRSQVARVMAGLLEDGQGEDAIAQSVTATLDGMQGARADGIAQYETDSGWFDASQQTWARNGVPMKVWQTGPDPDPGSKGEAPCLDNAYAGAIPVTDTFPSGDSAPPAHFGCICTLSPSGDPSDAAQAEPWLGG